MWICLAMRCGVVSGLESGECIDLAGLEGDRGLKIGTAVSGLDQLKSNDGGLATTAMSLRRVSAVSI